MATIHTWMHADRKRYSDMILKKPISAKGVQGGGSPEWNLKNIADQNALVGDLAVSAGENWSHYMTWVEALEGVTEIAGFNKTHEETVSEWQKIAADGYRPAAIAAAHDKKGKYYSFWTWRKNK